MSHLFDDEYDDAWRYERFITTIQQRAGISWAKAEQAAQATLETLAERMSSRAGSCRETTPSRSTPSSSCGESPSARGPIPSPRSSMPARCSSRSRASSAAMRWPS